MHELDTNIITPVAVSYFYLLSNIGIVIKLKYGHKLPVTVKDSLECSHCVPFWLTVFYCLLFPVGYNLLPFYLLTNVIITKLLIRYCYD